MSHRLFDLRVRDWRGSPLVGNLTGGGGESYCAAAHGGVNRTAHQRRWVHFWDGVLLAFFRRAVKGLCSGALQEVFPLSLFRPYKIPPIPSKLFE